MSHKRKRGLFRNLSALLILSYVSVMIVIMGLDMYSRVASLEDLEEQITIAYEQGELERVRDDANMVFAIMANEDERFRKSLESDVKIRTEQVHAFITNLHKQFSDDINESLLKENIISSLRRSQYGDNNYFFIRTLQGVSLVNPSTPEYEGKPFTSIDDPKMRDVIEGDLQFIDSLSEGVRYYDWIRPGETAFEAKVSYLKLFEPYGWIIGTGRYVSEILDEVADRVLQQAQHHLLGNKSDEFMLIVNGEGNLVHSSLATMEEGKPLVSYIPQNQLEQILETDGDTVQLTLEGTPCKKAYVRFFEPWGLRIISAIETSDLSEKLQRAHDETRRKIRTGILQLIAVFLVLIIISTMALMKIRRRLTGDMKLFVEFFKEAAQSGVEIDTERVRYQELFYLANYANSMVREKEEAQRKLVEMATIDQLTGCFNRRHFFESAETEFHREKRNEQPLSVAMLDIDHFKQVNDTYGHAAGDAVLTAVSALCRAQLRESDIFGRIGGEEFAIVMPETALLEAVDALNRLRQKIGEMTVTAESGDKISVTISVGVVEHQKRSDQTMVSLIKEADELLYRAKESGRNQVCS